MKTLTSILIFFAFVVGLRAQNVYNLPASNVFSDNNMFAFASGTPVMTTTSNVGVSVYRSISDNSGNLLFYTGNSYPYLGNTDKIYTKNHQVMPNGNNLGLTGLVGGNPILPMGDNKYFVLCVKTGARDSLAYTVVDMNLNNGLGAVTQRNRGFYSALNMNVPNIIAVSVVKHGNGRDWWFTAVENYPDGSIHPLKMIKYLVTPNGIDPIPTVQVFANIPKGYYDFWFGYFSPDGTKYFASGVHGQAHLFDFDRCSGAFSLVADLSLVPLQPDNGYAGGVFSHSGNALYISDARSNNVYQFDLNSANIVGSKTLVLHNPEDDPTGLNYGRYHLFLSYLQSDKKMYICNAGGSNNTPTGAFILDSINTKASVIQNPDGIGTACNLTYNSFNMNYPLGIYGMVGSSVNYDLGVVEASVCDSLFGVGVVALPARTSGLAVHSLGGGQYVVGFGAGTAELRLTDATGNELRQFACAAGTEQLIDISSYAQGIYFLRSGAGAVKLVR